MTTEKDKDKGGRPLKFKNVEDLQKQIKNYFTWAEEKGKPLTIERLCCFLKTERQTLLNYEERDEFFDAIKEAKQMIYASKAEMLNTKEGNTAGIIFDLCNNGDGYTNKHQDSNTGTNIYIAKDEGFIKLDSK